MLWGRAYEMSVTNTSMSGLQAQLGAFKLWLHYSDIACSTLLCRAGN